MKNCLPIMAQTFDEAKKILMEYNDDEKLDLYELRADCLDENYTGKQFLKEWGKFKDISAKPIIFTYRTKAEGGLGTLSVEEYNRLILNIIEYVKPDYLDIELFSCVEDAKAKMYTYMCKKNGITSILSRHNKLFGQSEREVELMLMRMHYLGCDIPKIAVRANNREDTEKLMTGAYKASKKIGNIIAIAMGENGEKSRRCGDEIGSIINFVRAVGKKSESAADLGQL